MMSEHSKWKIEIAFLQARLRIGFSTLGNFCIMLNSVEKNFFKILNLNTENFGIF